MPGVIAYDRAMNLKIDKYWSEFCSFYTCFVKDINYYYKYGAGCKPNERQPQELEVGVDD